MSQAIRWRKDCFVYTNKSERKNMSAIIESILESDCGNLCVRQVVNSVRSKVGSCEPSTKNALYYLVGLGILNVKGKRDGSRIFTLHSKWRERVESRFVSFIKDKE